MSTIAQGHCESMPNVESQAPISSHAQPALGWRWGVLLSLPLATAGVIWWTRPTPAILSTYSTTLQGRTSSQRQNIEQAALALNGVFIQAGEEFSFNNRVGPRTRLRGYVPAPAFMTATTVESIGGGICQVSSSLYSAALSAGLEVVERHAHYTPVQSVPPGLDATVWYGQADLKLRNPYPWPVQVQVRLSPSRLMISLAGKKSISTPAIRIQEHRLNSTHLQVTVYRDQRPLSQDRYVILPGS